MKEKEIDKPTNTLKAVLVVIGITSIALVLLYSILVLLFFAIW